MLRLISFLWWGLDAKLMVEWAFSGLEWNGKFLGSNVVEMRTVVKVAMMVIWIKGKDGQDRSE